MRYQAFALVAASALVAAQGVTEKIAPKGKAPEGCKPSADGKFEITIERLGDKLMKRAPACSGGGALLSTLSDGVIKDALDRTGYVASNFQFQFDGPPQAGAIYTSGFSVCENGSLALGDSTIFYQCLSGDFYNLYDRWWAAQCEPVKIVTMPCEEGAAVEVSNVGKVVGTSVVATTVVIPLADGQPQVITTSRAIPMCQIDDGQVQVRTTPCSAITPAPTPGTPKAPVTENPDGQIQVTPPVASGSVPTPPASAVPNATTLRTSPPPPSVVPTGAPPTVNGADRFHLGSAAALVIGIIGTVWAL